MAKRTHSQIWDYLKNGMGNRWHASRHEDMASVGIPDMSYGIGGISGWIEFKSLEKWPIRKSIKIRDLKIHQVRWMQKRSNYGGPCHLLVSVGIDWVLMDDFGADWVLKNGFPPMVNIGFHWSVWLKSIEWGQFSRAIV